MEKEMKLNVNADGIREYYKSADENEQKLLTLLFGEDAFKIEPEVKTPVTERIKTFEDAVKELGEDNPLVAEYSRWCKQLGGTFTTDLMAYLQLRIVVAALNEGWQPKFTEDEERWYPWFYLYTQDEYERMSESDKRRCVGRAGLNANSNGGLVYSYAFGASWRSYTVDGVRLALKSEELAEYAGVQFKELYADFILGGHEETEESATEADD